MVSVSAVQSLLMHQQSCDINYNIANLHRHIKILPLKYILVLISEPFLCMISLSEVSVDNGISATIITVYGHI